MLKSFYLKAALLGQDITAIQGAGGNISLKKQDRMLVKASGMWLSEVKEKNIFVDVSINDVLSFIEEGKGEFSLLVNSGELHPSIETPLHALMPHKVVIHTHCVYTIAQTLTEEGCNSLFELLKDFLWQKVPYVRPGLPLALAVKNILSNDLDKQTDVLVLVNHGLVVGGESPDEAYDRFLDVQGKLKRPSRVPISYDRAFLYDKNDAGWIIPEDKQIQSLVTDPKIFSVICSHFLYPDHVVFLGPLIPIAFPEETVSTAYNRLKKLGSEPSYIFYESKGILISPTAGSEVFFILQGLSLVCSCLSFEEAVIGLSPDDVAALVHWDAEAYRRIIQTE